MKQRCCRVVKVTDWNSARKAADIISDKGVDNVVITMGAQGAFIKEKDQYYTVDASQSCCH
jgi:ribokinase